MSTAAGAVLLAAAVLVAPRRRRLAPPVGARGSRLVRVLAVGILCGATVAVGPACTVSAGLFAVTLVVRRRRRRLDRETRCEAERLAAALEILVAELRVGSHPVRGFTVAAAESAGAVRASLAALAARARLGADVTTGLQAVAQQSSVPQYWTRIATCWQLAAEHGLPMAMLVQAAHRDITHRQRFVDRVDAGLSGARATTAVLAGLPLLGVLLGQLVGAQPLRFLFGSGGWILTVGVALQCAGIAWADRITDRSAS